MIAPQKSKILLCLILLLGILIYWAQFFLRSNVGGFNPDVYQPYQSAAEVSNAQPPITEGALTLRGMNVYSATCALCHQFTGQGDPAKAPPLVGAEWALAPGPNRIGRILLDGFTGSVNIKGQIWNLNMPSFKDNLTDEQMAAALSYIRNAWGNKASEIQPDQIKAIRQADKGRTTPWTEAELLRIPEM